MDAKLTSSQIKDSQIKAFQEKIWAYYQAHGRQFVWRGDTITPYKIFISEVMLQQTQTTRVADMFPPFIEAFPSFEKLANASFSAVLAHWKGLGYNNRALRLQKAAQIVVKKFNNKLPESYDDLISLPGIGPNTAGSIAAFAFNKTSVFIETNIRAVFIHEFFTEQTNVHDKDILELVRQTIDKKRPRHWYYALTDYGVFLKKNFSNPARKSKHHTKQSRFEGSDRQIRGKILQILLEQPVINIDDLISYFNNDPERINHIIEGLVKDKLLVTTNQFIRLT